METLNLGLRLSTDIRLRHYDGAGNLLGENRGHNDFTYAASDILMTALLRSGPSQVAYLYARYGGNVGSGQTGILVPAENDIKRTVRNDFVTSTGSPYGGLWVPLLATPIQTSSDPTLYSSNEVTYMFRIPYNIAAEQTSGATFDPLTSYIGALGLAVPPNFDDDRPSDVIFTALQYSNFDNPNPFLVPSAGQTAVDYTIRLES